MTGGMNDWIDLSINLVCAWIAVDYMDKGFRPRYTGWKRCAAFACGTGVYFLLVTAFNYLVGFEGIMGIGYGLVLFAYGFTALNGRRREMAVMSIIWVLIAFFSYYITASTVRLITGCSLESLYKTEFAAQFYAMFATILRLVMAKLVLAAKKSISGASGSEELILAGAFLAVFLMSSQIAALDAQTLEQNERNLLSFGLMLGFLGIIIALACFYQRLAVKNNEKLTREYDLRQFRQQQEQLEQLNQVCGELGRFRHDLTGMLDTVTGMMQNGKQEEALLCLERMNQKLWDCPAPAKSTGNEGLDMALLRTSQTCREQGIDFHYAIGGDVRGFDSMDMGILFYNLLGNAVEACKNLNHKEDAEISLQIWGKPDGIVCRLENPIEASVLADNPALRSGKPDKLLHGFGLTSIRDIVERCHGSFQISEEDGIFQQEIHLTLP